MSDLQDPGSDEVGVEDDLSGLQGSSIGRNAAQLMASQAVTWSLTTILAIILPRFIGPDALGDMRLALSLWTIALVFIGLGTGIYLTLAISRNRRDGMAQLGAVLLLRTVVFGAATLVLTIYVIGTASDVVFIWVMALVGVFSLLSTLSEAISAAFLGLERTSAPAWAAIVARTFGTVVSIVVVLLGGGVVGVVAVSVVSSALGLALLVRALRRVTTVSFRGWWSKSPVIVRGSAAFMVSVLILTTYREIDVVIISFLVDREVLGWYAIADQLVGSSLVAVTIVMTSIFPVLGRLYADDRHAFIDLVRRTAGSLLVIAVPVGLGIVLVGPSLAPLLLGEAFAPTGQVLVVYGFVIPFTFGTILVGNVALATGRERLWNGFMTLAIVMTIPLDLLLIPWADRVFSNGAIGGAMSYLVTEATMFAIGLVKIVPFLIERKLAWRSLRIVFAGGLMFAVAWPLRERFIGLTVLVSVVVYALAILALRIVTDDERLMIGRLLERVGLQTRWSQANGRLSIGAENVATGPGGATASGADDDGA